jgi:ribosomal protein S7
MTIKFFELKNQLVNTLLNRGNKKTGEKIFLKSLKLLQKKTNKNHKDLFQLAIINSTPTFKINLQTSKKGKRKTQKELPTFINNDKNRTNLSIKFIVESSLKKNFSHGFYRRLTQEILANTHDDKSNAIEHKNALQKQILLKKRYLHKFRW